MLTRGWFESGEAGRWVRTTMTPCPYCGQSPLTYFEFLCTIDARKTKCRSCGNQLAGDRLINAAFWAAVVFGVGGAGIAIYLEEYGGWRDFSALLSLVALVIVVVPPIDYYIWKHGAYIETPDREETQP